MKVLAFFQAVEIPHAHPSREIIWITWNVFVQDLAFLTFVSWGTTFVHKTAPPLKTQKPVELQGKAMKPPSKARTLYLNKKKTLKMKNPVEALSLFNPLSGFTVAVWRF